MDKKITINQNCKQRNTVQIKCRVLGLKRRQTMSMRHWGFS